jgi:crossover junction endodeoxyribonuclease RuvC
VKRNTDKIILGIDPGTRILGFGVIRVFDGGVEYVDMGVVNLKSVKDHFVTLKTILQEVTGIIDKYNPDELAIEAPFYGKNVQVMLKLGRAQGAAIAAALGREIPIFEYAPRSIKLAVTGKGAASKEQVADMLRRMMHLDREELGKFLDATDALAVAYCHFLQIGRPESEKKYSSWKDFVNKNKDRQSYKTIATRTE